MTDPEEFFQAAKEFIEDSTVTKKKAREVLISMGIYDEEGNLTDPYKS